MGLVRKDCHHGKVNLFFYAFILGTRVRILQQKYIKGVGVVQFRQCCQVWRLGPLDLTH